MREVAALFGEGRGLVGVVTPAERREPAMVPPTAIVFNSGAVHRIGPNRLSVRLARMLATHGVSTLRFDLSGIGDSKPRRDRSALTESWVTEALAAMEMLADSRGADRFLLMGNCSGAAAAYLAAHADPRVVSLVLINPNVPETLRYYLRLALTNRNSWRRLAAGTGKLRTLVDRLRLRPAAAPKTAQPKHDVLAGLQALARRGVDMLIVVCEWDPSYDHFHWTLRRELARPPLRDRVRLAIVPRSNHDFSMLASQERLIGIVDQWSARTAGEQAS